MSIAGPILAQEFFLTGYVNTRLADGLPKFVPPFLIAAAFAAAHLNHLGSGPLGPAFVGAMALQGYLWSSARTAGVSLLSLALAHGVLLIAYEQPAIALAITAAVMLAMATPAYRVGGKQCSANRPPSSSSNGPSPGTAGAPPALATTEIITCPRKSAKDSAKVDRQ